jgi:hypothetical protein
MQHRCILFCIACFGFSVVPLLDFFSSASLVQFGFGIGFVCYLMPSKEFMFMVPGFRCVPTVSSTTSLCLRVSAFFVFILHSYIV